MTAKILVNIALCFVSFALGRHSFAIWKNSYLEEKRKELIRYHAELLCIERDLEEKDEQIRKKWQAMVSDFSKYQAMAGGFDDTGKWTDMDDIYLNSWGSAEK